LTLSGRLDYFGSSVQKAFSAHSITIRILLEALRTLLLPWYLQVKFVHLFMIAMWSFSTAVAYRNFIVPAFRAWQRDPDNAAAIARRNEFMERFDNGAVLEHIAFPFVLLSGLLLVWLAGWSWQEVNWLSLKLGIVLFIFVPMEIVDYYLSHMGGNKRKIRATGNSSRYEALTQFHWRFFRVSTPLIIVLVPLVFYLAVTKPI
jgi:Predicted integral membrane protein (DUF2269)